MLLLLPGALVLPFTNSPGLSDCLFIDVITYWTQIYYFIGNSSPSASDPLNKWPTSIKYQYQQHTNLRQVRTVQIKTVNDSYFHFRFSVAQGSKLLRICTHFSNCCRLCCESVVLFFSSSPPAGKGIHSDGESDKWWWGGGAGLAWHPSLCLSPLTAVLEAVEVGSLLGGCCSSITITAHYYRLSPNSLIL